MPALRTPLLSNLCSTVTFSGALKLTSTHTHVCRRQYSSSSSKATGSCCKIHQHRIIPHSSAFIETNQSFAHNHTKNTTMAHEETRNCFHSRPSYPSRGYCWPDPDPYQQVAPLVSTPLPEHEGMHNSVANFSRGGAAFSGAAAELATRESANLLQQQQQQQQQENGDSICGLRTEDVCNTNKHVDTTTINEKENEEEVGGGRGGGNILVDDVGGVSSAAVSRIMCPRTVEDVIAIVRAARAGGLKVSMRGTQHTMGGQTIAPGGIVISMNALKDVDVSKARCPTQPHAIVGPGAKWEDLIRTLNPLGLSPRTMQSYCSFSIGGTIAVNAHGITTDHTLVESILWVDVVDASGSLRRCHNPMYFSTPSAAGLDDVDGGEGEEATAGERGGKHTFAENTELFRHVVGGYGLFAIIVRAAVKVQPNVAIEPEVMTLPVGKFLPIYESLLSSQTNGNSNNSSSDSGCAFGGCGSGGDDIDVKLARLDITTCDTVTLYLFRRTSDLPTQGDLSNGVREMSQLSQILYKWVLPPLRAARHQIEQRPGSAALDWGHAPDRNTLLYETAVPLARMTEAIFESNDTFILQEYFVPKAQFNAWIHRTRPIYKHILAEMEADDAAAAEEAEGLSITKATQCAKANLAPPAANSATTTCTATACISNNGEVPPKDSEASSFDDSSSSCGENIGGGSSSILADGARVHLLNTTIRFVTKDEVTALPYSTHAEGSFAFVLYYRLSRNAASVERLRRYQNALNDVALSLGGTFYLPYLQHHTEAQMAVGHPSAPAFFEAKRRHDPTYVFDSVWFRHHAARYPPQASAAEGWPKRPIAAATAATVADATETSSLITSAGASAALTLRSPEPIDLTRVEVRRCDSFRRLFASPPMRFQFRTQFLTRVFNVGSPEGIYSTLARLVRDPSLRDDLDIYDEFCAELRGEGGGGGGLLGGVISQLKQVLQATAQRKELTEETMRALTKLGYTSPTAGMGGGLSSSEAATEGESCPLQDYLSIGDGGKLVRSLRARLGMAGESYVANDTEPEDWDIAAAVERGAARPVGKFIQCDFANFSLAGSSKGGVRRASVDLITMNQGLHHVPPAGLATFLSEVSAVLRPGGVFIIREHDAHQPLLPMVDVAHMVFNALTGVPRASERAEVRAFRPVEEWRRLVCEATGFVDGFVTEMQYDDPTLDEMLLFVKPFPSSSATHHSPSRFSPEASAELSVSIPTWGPAALRAARGRGNASSPLPLSAGATTPAAVNSNSNGGSCVERPKPPAPLPSAVPAPLQPVFDAFPRILHRFGRNCLKSLQRDVEASTDYVCARLLTPAQQTTVAPVLRRVASAAVKVLVDIDLQARSVRPQSAAHLAAAFPFEELVQAALALEKKCAAGRASAAEGMAFNMLKGIADGLFTSSSSAASSAPTSDAVSARTAAAAAALLSPSVPSVAAVSATASPPAAVGKVPRHLPATPAERMCVLMARFASLFPQMGSHSYLSSSAGGFPPTVCDVWLRSLPPSLFLTTAAATAAAVETNRTFGEEEAVAATAAVVSCPAVREAAVKAVERIDAEALRQLEALADEAEALPMAAREPLTFGALLGRRAQQQRTRAAAVSGPIPASSMGAEEGANNGSNFWHRVSLAVLGSSGVHFSWAALIAANTVGAGDLGAVWRSAQKARQQQQREQQMAAKTEKRSSVLPTAANEQTEAAPESEGYRRAAALCARLSSAASRTSSSVPYSSDSATAAASSSGAPTMMRTVTLTGYEEIADTVVGGVLRIVSASYTGRDCTTQCQSLWYDAKAKKLCLPSGIREMDAAVGIGFTAFSPLFYRERTLTITYEMRALSTRGTVAATTTSPAGCTAAASVAAAAFADGGVAAVDAAVARELSALLRDRTLFSVTCTTTTTTTVAPPPHQRPTPRELLLRSDVARGASASDVHSTHHFKAAEWRLVDLTTDFAASLRTQPWYRYPYTNAIRSCAHELASLAATAGNAGAGTASGGSTNGGSSGNPSSQQPPPAGFPLATMGFATAAVPLVVAGAMLLQLQLLAWPVLAVLGSSYEAETLSHTLIVHNTSGVWPEALFDRFGVAVAPLVAPVGGNSASNTCSADRIGLYVVTAPAAFAAFDALLREWAAWRIPSSSLSSLSSPSTTTTPMSIIEVEGQHAVALKLTGPSIAALKAVVESFGGAAVAISDYQDVPLQAPATASTSSGVSAGNNDGLNGVSSPPPSPPPSPTAAQQQQSSMVTIRCSAPSLLEVIRSVQRGEGTTFVRLHQIYDFV